MNGPLETYPDLTGNKMMADLSIVLVVQMNPESSFVRLLIMPRKILNQVWT